MSQKISERYLIQNRIYLYICLISVRTGGRGTGGTGGTGPTGPGTETKDDSKNLKNKTNGLKIDEDFNYTLCSL